MVCPEGCGRGSAYAGSAVAGHSRLLAEGTKEEEREDDVAVLGLGGKEGGRGRRGRDNWLGKLPFRNPAAGGECSPHAGDAGPGAGFRVSGRGRAKSGGEVSILPPRLLRSFPGTFLVDCYLSYAFPSVCRGSDGSKIRPQTSAIFSWKNFFISFKLLMKVASFKFLSHLLRVQNGPYRHTLGWISICRIYAVFLAFV